MRGSWPLAGLVLLCLSVPLWGAETRPAAVKTYQVPYRLTATQHVLVRAKINGKGPFNFILDTGAPALFVGTAVAHKVGVEPDKNGWGTIDRFEIEGGVVGTKVKGRIEDPFQLEGMNGLGLAGAHLDGIIGYYFLAHYRLEFDFTKDKMAWTPLNYNPPPPAGLGGQGGGPAELDALGMVMKLLGVFLGKGAIPEVQPRGFLGLELADENQVVEVTAVLPGSPADRAGLKAGDRIQKFQGQSVHSSSQVQRLAARLTTGQMVKVILTRGQNLQAVAFKAGEGF
ncbi:MAG: PDZ domain-containing protein [Planctomycetes bacterium]|nr:PDZ domain-containing protein [Planctomycetota bacterium]